MVTEYVELATVATVTMGVSPKGDTYNETGEGLPLLNGPTEFGPSHPQCTVFTTDPVRACNKGDILLCVRGSTTGRLNWADRAYAIGRGIGSVRGASDTETRFVRYCIEAGMRRLLSTTGRTTFPNLNKDDLERF
ncbi:MAG TPA: restriction endonuclease subunit S, partial [Bacillota bacterium]|nr:restriction endonuclease subunit S [Bacillota bacterium]